MKVRQQRSGQARYASGMLAALALVACGAAATAADSGASFMISATVRGTPVEGLPLAWSDSAVHLLARDGLLWEFRPQEAVDLRKTSSTFHSYSFPELKGALERELGGQLEITSTAHYLVAHPKGAGRKWPERFEELYRSFVHYFAVRGLNVKAPEFPLVAIVWPSQADFVRYSRSQGAPVGPGLLGYYSPTNNRITLFDSANGKGDSSAWQQDAATIIHEATHQTAFNTGVHSRYALPPRWLAEGLGMLFEARGVYDSRHYPSAEDRLNVGRLKQFRQYVAAGRPAGAVVDLIDSDRLFQLNPAAAYAEAWALTYYLSETQPRKYNDYLAKTAARPKFEPYSAAQRRADFTAAFGSDLRQLEANYLRYIAGLK